MAEFTELCRGKEKLAVPLLTKYSEVSLELESFSQLKILAEENNTTIDNVATEILENHMATLIDIKDLSLVTEEDLKGFFIIYKDKIPIAKIKPISRSLPFFEKEKNDDKN